MLNNSNYQTPIIIIATESVMMDFIPMLPSPQALKF